MVTTGDTSDAPVRVYVDGTEIPVIDESVTTRVRKDGPGQITRLSDVYFPASWRGENVLTAINGFDWSVTDNQGIIDGEADVSDTHQIVRIEARTDTETHETIHYGYSRAVGSGGKGKRLRLQVGDFAHFLSRFPFGKQYQNVTADFVLNDIVERLEDELPFVDGIALSFAFDDVSDNVGDYFGLLNYRRNEDTLESVLNEITERRNWGWSFRYNPDHEDIFLGDPLELRIRELQPTVSAEEYANDEEETETLIDPEASVFLGHQISGAGQNVRILENEALTEISPINELTTYGQASGGTFPVVTARQTELFQRAGNTELSPAREEVDTSNLDETEARAKKRLIERLDGASHGLMVLEPTPEIQPYDTIRAKPVLSEYIDGEPPAISYEVQRVEHHFDAGVNDEYPRTEIDVGIRVSGVFEEGNRWHTGDPFNTESQSPIIITRSEEIDVNEE